MSTHNSPNSWSLQSCLKVAAGLALLSNIAIVNACQSSTLEAKWHTSYTEICTGSGCRYVSYLDMSYELNIRDRYQRRFSFTIPKASSARDLPERCSDDGVFCVTFNSPTDVKLRYGG
ncbi:hypothetical protein BGW42_005108, partial [Actinomortierella wolfii]